MTKLIGASRTKDLVYSARLLDAKEAHFLGIVNHLALDGDATTYSLKLAEAMAQNGPIAVRAAKAAINQSEILDVESALDFERASYERCLQSKDRNEGLLAFAEKRKPEYKGE
jgi:methylglutaconyl-CoA hydratase